MTIAIMTVVAAGFVQDGAAARAAAGDCGIQCSYMSLIACGQDPGDFDTFAGGFGEPETVWGMSMAQLEDVMRRHGLHVVGARLTLDELNAVVEESDAVVVPICHFAASHFVVAEEIGEKTVTYFEPPEVKRVPRSWFGVQWTDGNVLLVSAEPIVLPAAPWPWWCWLLPAGVLAAVGGLLWFRRTRGA